MGRVCFRVVGDGWGRVLSAGNLICQVAWVHGTFVEGSAQSLPLKCETPGSARSHCMNRGRDTLFCRMHARRTKPVPQLRLCM